jgi:hypothetical protein
MVEKGATSIILRGIDPELHYRFKVRCLQDRVSMREAILEFMRQFSETPIYKPLMKRGTE